MSAPTHQTVRLARGRHSGPDHGVCVMELASMLAGEPFSDRPRTVCPVIAAFMRTYNDGLDDTRRQDLYEFASASVGTRASRDAQQLRARMCAEWVSERQRQQRRRGIRALLPLPLPACGVDPPAIAAGRLAARSVMRNEPGARAAVHAFVERLIACGSEAARADITAEQAPTGDGAPVA